MFKIILIILLFACIYESGKIRGEKETLETIKEYLKQAKDWDEFMEKISIDFNRNDIEV